MRNFKSKRGPFAEQPYYTDSEIEAICTDELRAVGLYPSRPEPVRIDRFIEKKFKIVPRYEDLGEAILGLTVFGRKGVKEIVIARSLEDENTQVAERRIRTTLAHEGGHGLLHAHLFVLAPQNPLFGDATDPEAPKVLCRGEAGGSEPRSYKGEWWEFQANCTIGGLLMPRSLVEKALERFMVQTGQLGFTTLDRSRYEQAARLLAQTFDVNPAVSRIRIDQIYPVEVQSQMSL